MVQPQQMQPRELHEWFDPYNIEHISAYQHLKKVGHWPAGFIPSHVNIPSSGLGPIFVANKMADAWVTHMLDDTTL